VYNEAQAFFFVVCALVRPSEKGKRLLTAIVIQLYVMSCTRRFYFYFNQMELTHLHTNCQVVI